MRRRLAAARFRTRLWVQFRLQPRLATSRLLQRLPWPAWCAVCAGDAGAVVREIARRAGRPLTFLQVGANDGVANDPLHETVRAAGWTGVAVEPVPSIHERLVANYRDVPGVRAANVAIGDADGTATIYEVLGRPGDPDWVGQIASLDRDVVLTHRYALPDLDERVVATQVEAVRLPSLVTRYGLDTVDVMHVDAEGYDAEVVEQIDTGAPWAPRFLVYEKKHIGADRYRAMRSRLEDAGYRIVDLWPDELAYRGDPSAAS